jgi:hypothetical protein
MVNALDEKLGAMIRASRWTLAVLCGAAALLLCANDTFAQRYAPDGSVIPDPVTRPEDSRPPPALRPEDRRADPVLSPDAVRPDPVRSPDAVRADPVLSPDAVKPDPVLSPDAVKPDPVRRAD